MTAFRRPVAALTTVLLAAVLSAGAAACSTTSPPVPSPPAVSAVLTASELSTLRAYGAGDSAFGMNVLSALCRAKPGGNVVLSPVSLETGLGMAYLGARGVTATAMAKVLHLPAAGQALASGLRARSALLASLNRPGVTFTTSNRIWADPSLVTNRSYLAELRAGYQAGLTHLPLLSDPEKARSEINSVIATDTRGHIKDLLPSGSIPPHTIGWVLTDALYLNAAWKVPFEHARTGAGAFAAPSGKVTAHYLNGGGFTMATSSGWTAVSLPYQGNRLSMVALLPPAGGTAKTCALPGQAQLGALTAKLATSREQTAIKLPKVNLASSEPLHDVLTALGMGAAFGADADFSGISPQAGGIGFVQHAATLKVAEKGTVASAATATGVISLALRVQHLVAYDRPYLLMLRDSMTGEPLMLAWVANPAQS
jgi:serine protease inhibitor